MRRLGIPSHLLIPLKILLNVRTFVKPLTPSILILAVELNPYGIAFSNIVHYFLLLLFHTFHFSPLKNIRYEKEERFYHC